MLTPSPVISNREITTNLHVLTLIWKGNVQAGQFFMLQTPHNSQVLPRPISVFDYDKDRQTLSFLIRTRGDGTQALNSLKYGDQLNIFGPLGQGFDTALKDKEILLLSGGEGIAPMLLTAKNLKYHNNVRLFAGFRTKEELEILNYFSSYEDEIEIKHTCQEENNALVTQLLEDEPSWPDYAYICGPMAMMKSCVQSMNKWKNTKKFVSLENSMPCGVGACMGCTVKGKKGIPLRPCSEGPVFNAMEVF